MTPARRYIAHVLTRMSRRRININTTWEILATNCQKSRKGYYNERVHTKSSERKLPYTTI